MGWESHLWYYHYILCCCITALTSTYKNMVTTLFFGVIGGMVVLMWWDGMLATSELWRTLISRHTSISTDYKWRWLYEQIMLRIATAPPMIWSCLVGPISEMGAKRNCAQCMFSSSLLNICRSTPQQKEKVHCVPTLWLTIYYTLISLPKHTFNVVCMKDIRYSGT